MILISKRTLTRSALSMLMLSSWLLTACSLPSPDRGTQAPEWRLNDPAGHMHWHEKLAQLQSAQVILLGEQHDAPEHHAWEADTVRELATRGRLAALVLEMADAGATTAGLPAEASEADVQKALNWSDKGWPWASYGPAVMAAVRTHVPVLGGNLPRAQMGDVMKNPRFDGHLKPEALQIQIDAIKAGHCDLLPESQWLPMTRIQLARDESMAQVLKSAIKPDRTTLLIAGHGHVRTDVGVPLWLPRDLPVRAVIAQAGTLNPELAGQADFFVITPELPAKDHCAELRQHFKK